MEQKLPFTALWLQYVPLDITPSIMHFPTHYTGLFISPLSILKIRSSQLNEDSNVHIFQHDGSPAHYHKDVRGYFKRNLPQRWIGRTGKDDALMR
jgi:hypothetical protein